MCEDDHTTTGMGRRALFVTGAATALTLSSVSFASAADGRTPADGTKATKTTQTVKGTLPPGAPDFVYVPVEVPRGVREIHVSYTYTKATVPAGTQNNALDIGVFDERGTELGGKGFRGWSGGARTEFFVRADDATPGYIPGPVRAGTWHIALGPYTVAPEGLPYELTVTLTYGEQGRTPHPVYPPSRAKGRGRAWYRGDCHLHSWFSDGRRTPAEIAALARAAGLDFINSSDHNTHSSHAHWADQAGDDLLIMLGEEITTRNGHVVALGTDPGTFVDWRYRARDNRFGTYAREVRRAGGLVVPAHPHATCIGCNWKFGFGEADAVEVWNGPYTADDEISLADWDNTLVAAARGSRRWIPAMGNSDAHRDPDRIGGPQTVVLADDLTREAIQAGIKAGRSYVAESKSVELTFTASGSRGEHAGIGERLHVDPDAPVTVRLEVKGAPGCTLHVVTDQGTLFTAPALPESGSGTAEWRTTASYAAYVRAEVRHAPTVPGLPALTAFTNPVFLGT
ncbi:MULTISPECIES: CehA/McbA family metallohydrolase [unclassified Streptomyces]|uniref:CehA/McbA family metallohydrolase n=1 Tax=Streptomyces sp. NBC_00119 TaxID=2975659 RepID=A0AAU1U9I0_9ACTN|nr:MULTISPECIES: CehA/McbA family metallohydrolase [unclassified Streptomyces]MCX4644835.1 CehA/McbA family metallohydrolase [Streptomyces sp. NBC_01446]MCX5326511.1 CehA/McbA family metallohydrolase [Streptomyces sp. NBC_00120]